MQATTEAAIDTFGEQNQQDPRSALIARIIASKCLRSSQRMREFLLYVADCALRNAPEEATEQQIGIYVFGRMAGYNSSEDSIVRTHARLLRVKLREYFAEEGALEPLVLEIPKGHYLPVFSPRETLPHASQHSQSLAPEVLEAAEEPAVRSKALPVRLWGSIGVVLAVLIATGSWAHHRTTVSSPLVDRFWQPFMTDGSSLVIYSNALFTGDSKNGLKYADPQEAEAQHTPESFVDTYTGVGEVAGVYELTRLFDNHQSSFLLKRSMLVTWDEAKLRNLIFIGSVAENPSLRDVTSTTDFTLTTGAGYSGIVNHHPRPGEQALYSVPLPSPTKDYAILAYLPGQAPNRHMLIYSGLMTIGTQGAVDFTCHPEQFQELLQKAKGKNGELLPFEAVLETSIGGGVPLQTRLVALHTR
jgi:hypothetical protein